MKPVVVLGAVLLLSSTAHAESLAMRSSPGGSGSHAPAVLKLRKRTVIPRLKLRLTTMETKQLVNAPAIPRKRKMGHIMLDNLNLISNDVALHLNTMTMDLVDMKFDIRKRRAKLRVGGGSSERLKLRIDGDIKFEKGYARIDAAISIGVAGHEITLELPEVDMVPRSMNGERWVEVRLPLISGRF